jgi:DNA-directed RNA polymerase subunit RPC12/RpoP
VRNRFAGRCFRCGREVKAGDGHFQRDQGKWLVRCLNCVGKGNAPMKKWGGPFVLHPDGRITTEEDGDE